MQKTLHTHELFAGDRLRFVGFGETELSYRRRLLALGLTQGVEVLLKRFAPLGCPLELEFRGLSLILRKEEAAHLLWERP